MGVWGKIKCSKSSFGMEKFLGLGKSAAEKGV